MKRPIITVIGSANLDFIMQVDHLPAVGETVTNARFFQSFGGKGANQAVAAARAGGSVNLVAALGNDASARSYLQHLKHEGIHTEHVSLEAKVPGGAALVMFDAQGDNYLSVAPGANDCMTPARVRAVEDLIAASDWIVLQQEIPPESNCAALELAAHHNRPVLLNYAPAHDLRLRPSELVDGLVLNEMEAASLTGKIVDAQDRNLARQLAGELCQSGGHRFVVITLGKAGAVFADETGSHQADACKVDAVDTTAAGDTFCGALAVSLGEKNTLTDAIAFASAASALAVTKIGAQTSIPTRSEIESFLSG